MRLSGATRSATQGISSSAVTAPRATMDAFGTSPAVPGPEVRAGFGVDHASLGARHDLPDRTGDDLIGDGDVRERDR